MEIACWNDNISPPLLNRAAGIRERGNVLKGPNADNFASAQNKMKNSQSKNVRWVCSNNTVSTPLPVTLVSLIDNCWIERQPGDPLSSRHSIFIPQSVTRLLSTLRFLETMKAHKSTVNGHITNSTQFTLCVCSLSPQLACKSRQYLKTKGSDLSSV